MTEIPQSPPTSLLAKGRELLAKLRRPHISKLGQFSRQAAIDMMKEIGGPQDTVARNTLDAVSKQVTETEPPKP